MLQGDKLKWESMGSSICLTCLVSILFEVVEHKHVGFSAWGHCHGMDNCQLDRTVICLGGEPLAFLSGDCLHFVEVRGSKHHRVAPLPGWHPGL